MDIVNRVHSSVEVHPDNFPTEIKEFRFPKIYQTNVNGAKLEWCIGFDGKNTLYMVFGHSKGKLRHSHAVVHVNKSGRNLLSQVEVEMKSRHQEKIDKGYFYFEKERPLTLVKPMLALKYDDKFKWAKSQIQVKLDGIRMMASLFEDEIKSWTRLNKIVTNLPEIESNCEKLLKHLPEGTMLDGEIYNHDMTFSEITSAFKTVKLEHPDRKRLQYYIFDIYVPNSKLGFVQRYQLLSEAMDLCFKELTEDKLVLVECVEASCEEEMMKLYLEALDEGFEGLMIRKDDLYAPGKRNRSIVKVKPLEEDEATIVEVKEGEGTEEGTAIFVMDWNGITFAVRNMGSMEVRRKMFKERDILIGKRMTFKYQCLTDSGSGAPRFPVGKEIRDYE